MIGILGPVIFTTSSLRVLTPRNMTREVSSRWAVHEVIGGKPRPQYLGPGLQKFQFSLTLDANYGVRPRALMAILNAMCENKIAYPLIIGGFPVGEHSWRILSVSEEYNIVYNRGEIARATVDVSLEEYV